MKTIVFIGTSLDGFIAKTDRDFDWLSRFANDEAVHAYEELIDRIDAIVIGRGTFIYVDGGKVIQAFLKENLVDELIISKAPIIIGSGIPLFGYLDHDVEFKHTRTDVCSNGLVRSSYERK